MSGFGRLAFLCILFLNAIEQSKSQERIAQPRVGSEHTQWIAAALKAIQTIKVGMTRRDLMKLFTVEGGLSTTS